MNTVVNDKEYAGLLEAIRFMYGYDFTDYAPSSIRRRIDRFMDVNSIDSLNKLGKLLLNDVTMFEDFVDQLSVTVTEMFRDPSFYRSLRDVVVKQLETYPVIRIWIAGCATGQEVYSLAILLKEERLLNRCIIYATDINQQSLQTARQGIYSLSDMQGYTQNYIESGGKAEFSKYYLANHNAALFDRELNLNVVFSPHNLVADGSFNEFQLIICRNVIMYFNQQLQNRVIKLFHESLCPFGYLGLGSKESLLFAGLKDSFQEVDRREKIYRKIK